MRSENLRVDALLAGFGLAWVGLVCALFWRVPALNAPLLLFMCLLAVCAALLVFSPSHRSLLLSPLFLLGLLSCLFFTIPPWLWLHAPPDLYANIPSSRTDPIRRFVNGEGLPIVLQFSALAFLISLVLARLRRTPRRDTETGAPAFDPGCHAVKVAAGAIAAIAGGAAFSASHYFSMGHGGVAMQLSHAAAPLIAIGAVTLVALAIRRPPIWSVLAVAGLAVGCTASLLLTNAAKTAVFLALSALAYFVVQSRLSPRGLIAAGAGVVAVLVIVLMALTVMRSGPYWRYFTQSVGFLVGSSVQGKLVARQADTGACLQVAVERAGPQGKSESPFYFLAVFVPRFLWPGKPNFSLGNVYADTYCGSVGNPRQSASITLLGQPIVRAGWIGLAVAEAVLVIGLAVVTLLAERGGAIGRIALAALLPWLIDFDQSFALYLGNAVKMFLWMLPLLVPIAVLTGRARRTGAGQT